MKKTTVYLPVDLHAQLLKVAQEEKRSFNSEMVFVLEQYVKKRERQRAKNV